LTRKPPDDPDEKTMNSSYTHIAYEGLWKNNAGLVQLLGLCPLLAVSNSVVNALGLGLATLLVVTGSSLLVSLSRQQLTPAIRLPVFMLLIAALTTCVEMLMQMYTYTLYQSLGIFVPLIVSNCMILGRAESFASSNPPLVAAVDGLVMGAGFLLLFVVMGAIRELLGTGALFADFDTLLPFAANWRVQVFETDSPLLLAVLPPGAFLTLGALVALKNVIDRRFAPLQEVDVHPIVTGSKRVRVTGKI
jgi:electron transport complex protein RnfE